MHVDANPNFFVRFNERVVQTLRGDPLPQEGKMWKVAKRVATVAVAPFVYLAMAIYYGAAALVHVFKKLTNQPSDTPLEGLDNQPVNPHRPDAAPQNEHISVRSTLDEIIEDNVCGSITADFGERLDNGNFVAVDILLNITVGNAGPHLRHLHVKNDQMRDAETIHEYIRELYQDMNYLLDYRLRSNSLAVKWLVLFRDNTDTYSYSQRNYIIHDNTTSEPGSVTYDLTGPYVAQICSIFCVDIGFPRDQNGPLLSSISRRNETEDYHELGRI